MELHTAQTNNLTLIREVLDRFKREGMEAFLDVLDPDVEAHPSVGGGPVLRGRQAVSDWWRAFLSLDGDIEIRPLGYEDRGSCVVVRGYLRQREGRTLAEREVYWLYEFRDGQIVRMGSHPTRESALAAC